jgi:hypothetical protein
MSNQNATLNAPSNTAALETEFPFAERLKLAASRQSKGVTRERQALNRNKLVTSMCADYRAHFASLYGKTDRLPSAIYEQIENAVDNYIATQLEQVNKNNVIAYRRAFHHNFNGQEITERVVLTGENKLTLQEQHCGVVLFIGSAERKLKDLEAKKTPDYDREKQVREQIMKLNVTKAFIEGEIAHQSKLAGEVAKS